MFGESKKRGVIVIVLFFFIVILAYNINAFGISTPYLENDTLKVLPGQNYTYTLSLQNGDEEGYYVDIMYASTKNVAALTNVSYYIPAKTYDNKFNFMISIPIDAKFGEKYILEYSAKPRVSNSTSVLGLEIKRSVQIVVTDKSSSIIEPAADLNGPHASSDTMRKAGKYLIGIAIIILLIILVMRLWTLSMNISKKLERKSKTTYTISQAISLAEVRTLMQKLSDEEFELTEIRTLFKNKLSELTNNEIVTEISHISRREAIIAMDHILK
jgi:hypothetical protein